MKNKKPSIHPYSSISSRPEPERSWLLDAINRVEGRRNPHHHSDEYRSEAAKICRAAALNVIHFLEKNFRRELHLKKEPDLYKWQLELLKENSKLEPVFKIFNYFRQHSLSFLKGLNLANELKISYFFRDKKGQQREYVLFIPDYLYMEDKVDLGRRQIQRYLRRFRKLGLIKGFRKTGSHGNKIYGVGYWSRYKDELGNLKRRRNSFLKNTPEVRKILKDFKLQ